MEYEEEREDVRFFDPCDELDELDTRDPAVGVSLDRPHEPLGLLARHAQVLLHVGRRLLQRHVRLRVHGRVPAADTRSRRAFHSSVYIIWSIANIMLQNLIMFDFNLMLIHVNFVVILILILVCLLRNNMILIIFSNFIHITPLCSFKEGSIFFIYLVKLVQGFLLLTLCYLL